MPQLNTVNGLPDVTPSTQFSEAIFYFYEAGILTGTDSAGTFAPGNSIVRAEAAAIFMRLVDSSLRNSGGDFGG